MKTGYIYMLLGMLAGAGTLQHVEGHEESPRISVTSNTLKQKGDSLYIDADIHVSGAAMKSTHSMVLTPVLETPAEKIGLPAVLLLGKRSAKVYSREKKLNNLKDEEPRYRVLVRTEPEEQTVSYRMVIAYEPWMKEARFVLADDVCGCGKSVSGEPLLIADQVKTRPAERYRVQPAWAYISPEAESEKCRAELGTAYLDYRLDRWEILPDYHHNRQELAKIDATIEEITSDNNITVRGMLLKGYASPEGRYSHNAVLARNRVQSLREYIGKKYHFPESFFTVESEPENWAGFRKNVSDDPDFPNREDVLAIIDSDDKPDVKEARLRKLAKGRPFQYALQEYFPFLRRTDYRVDYEVRFFTVEEGREIIKKHPEQLCLSEMFAVANTYETGSTEYKEVFKIAVRLYADDPAANLNAANIAMEENDYAAARGYLEKAGDSSEAVHARGVLLLLEGNLDEAEPLLEQAARAGIKEAAYNLNELRKKREDNRVFDEFDR